MPPRTLLSPTSQCFSLRQFKIQRLGKNLFRALAEIDADTIQPDVQTKNNSFAIEVMLLPLASAFFEDGWGKRCVFHGVNFWAVDLHTCVGSFAADQNQSGGVNGWEEPSRLPQGKTMTSTRGFRSPFFISSIAASVASFKRTAQTVV
ncbi:MAG TPA: hypothetical protein PKA41_15420 [Verrucomicrobiota bacterium]|nr:hypothetical protein [Verrucomicrobiota bacterium]